MIQTSDPTSTIDTILRDLEVIRQRLEQAPEWLANGDKTISAAALAEEIRKLCEQASKGEDLRAIRSSIAEAEKLLQKLHVLLGVH